MAATEEGLLLIADISGYTGFLRDSELEHAQDTLTSLLSLLIDHTRPPLKISRLAGDAVISYLPDSEAVEPQTFLEMIDAAYVAFRRAIELMVLNTDCQCNACRNIGTLDLKFFVHRGVFGIQHLGPHDELVGSDVNVIHRLTKNHIVEACGFSAYVALTSRAAERLLPPAVAWGCDHVESYPDVGDIRVWVRDMTPVWITRRDALRVDLDVPGVLFSVEAVVSLPPERVWDAFVVADRFNVLAGGTKTTITDLESSGRVGVGSIYRCYHGEMVMPQVVLEWTPFERIVVRLEAPVETGETFIFVEYRLSPHGDGTTITQTLSRAVGPPGGAVAANEMFLEMGPAAQADMDAFARSLTAAG